MDDPLRAAVALFNHGRFVEFQDSLEGVAGTTRAASERQFYRHLALLAEALHQLSNNELGKAEEALGRSLRKLEDYTPRFRGLNVEALCDDVRRTMSAIREMRAGKKAEFDPKHLPRLRMLPA
jgi:hypothetical protein